MSIAVKLKDKVFGETLNVGELIEGINDEMFNVDDIPVSITTQEFSGDVVAIYKCKECEKIHLLGNNYSAEEDKDYAFDEEDLEEYLESNAKAIYGKNIPMNKIEILETLNKLSKKSPIVIGTFADEHPFTLTGVYKCSEECPAIHLDSSYGEHSFNLN